VTGTVREDQVLTADTSTIADADGLGTLHYQWQRNSGTGFANVGLDQATYTLGDADVGATMRVVVGYIDGHGTTESVTSAATAAVTNVNDAPAVAASGGTTAALEQSALAVDAGVTVADVDNATLASATVAITGGFHGGEDGLAFANNGSTMGNIAGSYAAGTGILTLISTGASATLAQWQAALRAVTYTDVSDVPNTVDRTISFVVNDGTLSSVASTKTVSVTAVNDVPVAHDDGFTTLETTALSGGNVFANNNGASSDDPDGGSAFSVTAVNGNTANVGHEITLASGGHLTVNANGTFSYDPNHAFDYVPVSSSGASNTPATDQFTYTITGGSAATVTLTTPEWIRTTFFRAPPAPTPSLAASATTRSSAELVPTPWWAGSATIATSSTTSAMW
jgi:VCBS repeat-containing protein